MSDHVATMNDKTTIDTLIEQTKKEQEQKRINFVVAALNKLKDQFQISEKFIKEPIQNSIDAGASRIDITDQYDTEKNLGYITIQDNGSGMSEKTIREYLLNKFDSSKDADITKIGRFGVGFVSLFAQDDLERVIVQTNDGKEEHRVVLLPPKYGWKGTIFKKKGTILASDRGTTVTLEIASKKTAFEGTIKKVYTDIDNSCAYTTAPLFVQGKQANKEFNIPDAIYQMRFGGSEIEGVIGYTTDTAATFSAFFNRRLLVSHEFVPLFSEHKDLSVMVSSSYIDYNISRDKIIKNKKYAQIVNLVKKKHDQIIFSMMRDIESEINYGIEERPVYRSEPDYSKLPDSPGSFFNNLSSNFTLTSSNNWSLRKSNIVTYEKSLVFTGNQFKFNKIIGYVEKSLEKEKEHRPARSKIKRAFHRIKRRFTKDLDQMLGSLSDEVRETKLFTAIKYINKAPRFQKVSLNEIMDQALQYKGILAANQYDTLKLSEVSLEFLRSGKILIPDVLSFHDPQNKLLSKFGSYINVDRAYSAPSYENEQFLEESEKNFLAAFRTIVDKSPLRKHIGAVAYGRNLSKEKPYDIDTVYNTIGKKSVYAMKQSWKSRLSGTFLDRKTMFLNRTNGYMQKAIQFSSGNDYSFLSYVSLLNSLAYELIPEDKKITRKMENFVATYFKEDISRKDSLLDELDPAAGTATEAVPPSLSDGLTAGDRAEILQKGLVPSKTYDDDW